MVPSVRKCNFSVLKSATLNEVGKSYSIPTNGNLYNSFDLSTTTYPNAVTINMIMYLPA